MSYNLTTLQNANNIVKLFEFVNGPPTNGLFIPIMLIAIYIIMLMGLKRYGFDNALLVSSWIAFLMSLLLRSAGLISVVFMLAFLFITALITMYKITVRPSPY